MAAILSLLSVVSYGQQKDDYYRKMIDSAIILQINALGVWEKIDDIYLIDQNDLPYVFLTNNYQIKFKPISIYDKGSKKYLKAGINAWKVIPILDNNKLVVKIINFTITYSRGNYNYANGGGAKVVFEYSCTNNKWELTESNWSGI